MRAFSNVVHTQEEFTQSQRLSFANSTKTSKNRRCILLPGRVIPKVRRHFGLVSYRNSRPQNNVEAINQKGTRRPNQSSVYPSIQILAIQSPITQSLRRIARTTTIFQLSDQKFEHMMIIDDKSGTRSSQPPQESQMVCRNVQINRTIVRLSARPFRQDSLLSASIETKS